MILALPEILVLLTAFAAFVLDLFVQKKNPRFVPYAVMTGLALASASLFWVFPVSGNLLGGRFVVDSGVLWFKLIFLLAAFFSVTLSTESFEQLPKSRGGQLEHGSEFFILLLLTLLGMMLLVSSRDMATIYVSLELSTIPLFLLSAWSKNSLSSEAGLKYVVLGAMSSALLLFGMSIMYGLSGQMSIEAIASAIQPNSAYWFALALIGSGVGFKLALFPFHMWAPDVYEGAPTPVTAYLSVASKTAGVALAVVLFARLAGSHLSDWSTVIALISALTMTLGNVAAIAQHNIKRFMAYSSISQAGYIIMGFIGSAPEGFPAIIYYLLGYLVTNIAVFAVIILYANQTGREEISDYAGLSESRPLLALVMMVALFSLAGIPPLAGFTGKFFLFSVAAKSGYYWLVTLAAVNSTISLFYYLKIVRQMYIEAPLELPSSFSTSRLFTATLCITLVGTILIGVLPVFYETISSQTLGRVLSSGVK
jgi:NADH-quinone oxidoreductase subunit N